MCGMHLHGVLLELQHHNKAGNTAGVSDEETIKELNAAKERLQQMTNKNGVMEQKVTLL